MPRTEPSGTDSPPQGFSHTRFQAWGWGRLGLSPGCPRVSPPLTCPLFLHHTWGGLSHPPQPSPAQPYPYSVPQACSTSSPSWVLAYPPRGLGNLHMQLVVSSQAPQTLMHSTCHSPITFFVLNV